MLSGKEHLASNLTNDEIGMLKNLLGLINKEEDIVTAGFAVDEYLQHAQSNKSENTTKSIKLTCKHFIAFYSEHRIICRFDVKNAELLLAKLQINAPKGYRVYYRTLKAMFNKFVDWQYIQINPFNKIKLPKQQSALPLFINEIDLKLICSKIDNSLISTAVRLGYFSGLRRTEIVMLKCDNVDSNKKVITVGSNDFQTKNRKQRFVPLSEKMIEELKNICAHRKGSDYIFSKNGFTPYTGDWISRSFKRACSEAGINECVHFHTLRHSTASNMVNNGADLYRVQRILGHSSIQTTQIYAHLGMDEMREAIDLL